MRIIPILAGLAVFGAFAMWFLSAPAPAIPQSDYAALEQGGDAAHGRNVFYAGGCAACHATPGQDDRLRLGGGLKLPSPFGAFTVPNISPHPTDGIGAWKTGDLANAMLSGVSPNGAHYYPAFPYVTYAHARIDDIKDLMAFLRTLAPVEGKAAGHDLPFPFNIRRSLGLWKLLFLSPGELAENTARNASWNHGAYLVEALSHCGECHTPRNILGGQDRSRAYAGGPNPEGKGRVPNITPDPTGIGKWSKAEIVEVLASGFTPEFDSVGSTMAAVVRNTAELPASDREAIAEYIMSLAPVASEAKKKKAEQPQ
jgi:mono/diheme cytochrome c family protein